ncbi:GcrA family cell cycle regulator [Bradyrhizobium sp. 13971]
MNWLPEHSAALQDLRARDLSYSEIADTINATFNTAYTRNAALSRAQRMGLAGLERLRAVPVGAPRSAQIVPAGAPKVRAAA